MRAFFMLLALILFGAPFSAQADLAECERALAPDWQRILAPLREATDLRLKQPFAVRFLNAFGRVSILADSYDRAIFRVAREPSLPLPKGARWLKGGEFGYRLPKGFTRLGPINYLVLGADGRVLEVGGGTPELIQELKAHLFGRKLNDEEMRTISKLNHDLFAMLRANPEAQARLNAFARKRGWPEGLENDAGLAYFDDALTPIRPWALAKGYSLSQLRDAGWVRLSFDDRGRPIYHVMASDSIRIPFFSDESHTEIPLWRIRNLSEAQYAGKKYLHWPLDRSIERDYKASEKLYGGWDLGKAAGKTLVITEGEFKCLVASRASGLPVVGIPGITQFDDTIVRALVDAHAEQYVITLDRDPRGKGLMRADEVSDSERAAYVLARELEAAGATNVRVGRIPDVFDGAKVGIDDLILSRGVDAFRAVIDSAVDSETYAATAAIDPVFQELFYRRQKAKKAIERYRLSSGRGGERISPIEFAKAKQLYAQLDQAYHGYLESEFGGARMLAEPSHRHYSLPRVRKIPGASAKSVQLADGQTVPIGQFSGAAFLLDYVTSDLNPRLCQGVPCESIPYDSASIAHESPDLARGKAIAEESGFTPHSEEDAASILIAGLLARDFPPDDYRMEFNVRLVVGEPANRVVETAPLVIFRRHSMSYVAIARLRTKLFASGADADRMLRIQSFFRGSGVSLTRHTENATASSR